MAGIDMDVPFHGYEFRILIEDTFTDEKTKQQVPYMTMLVEHPDTCEQQRISVPEKLRAEVRALPLRKGDYVDLLVHVRANTRFQSTKLIEVQHVYSAEDGEVHYDGMGY